MNLKVKEKKVNLNKRFFYLLFWIFSHFQSFQLEITSISKMERKEKLRYDEIIEKYSNLK